MRSEKRILSIFLLSALLAASTVFSACQSPNTTENTATPVPPLTTKSEEERTAEPSFPPEPTVVPTQPQSESGSETEPSQGETDPVLPSESENVEPGTPETPTGLPSESETVKPTDPPVSSKVEPVTPGQYTGGPLDFDSDQDVLFDRANQLHAERAIYITFDDGPSYLTEGLLDVLDQYHVKATFFVVYKPEYEAVYRDIVSRGHALGVHCAVHDYDHLYANFETWQADFDKMYNYLRDTIGYTPRLYRFPGGSIRKLEWKDQLIAYLKSKNVVYWDWNVVTEDGDQNMPKEQIMENAVQGTQRILPVILSHDGDGQDVSVGCIPEVLQFYLDKGFTFRVLDDTVPPIQQGGGIHKWDYYK